MLGSAGITEGLVLHIREHMPRTLQHIRDEQAVAVADLPDMKHVYPHAANTISTSEFPALFVEERETTGRLGNRETDDSADWDEYSFRYRYRIWVWVVGTSEGRVSLQVKRHVQALEMALLQDKQIHDDGKDSARVDPGVIRHSYSEAARDQDRNMVAGAYVETEIVTQERMPAYPNYATRPQTTTLATGQL